MKKERFDELLKSVKQAKAIEKGALKPTRAFKQGSQSAVTRHSPASAPNHGLVDLLLACPASFKTPARDKDDNRPVKL